MNKTVRTCLNPDDCQCPGCALPAYRHEDRCFRCGAVTLVVWYCLTCKHMMEAAGPDHTDHNRLNICFSWPNPPFKIPFRTMRVCGSCKDDITDIGAYGVAFRPSYRTAAGTPLPGVFLRYEVYEEPTA